MVKKKGLGKGLGALLSDEKASIDSDSITEIKLIDIEPNMQQPRKLFDEEKLTELSDSIRQHGIITPILVHKSENGYYKIIAGERRWRAAKLAGLKTIPAIVKNLDNLKVFEVSLIENLQRQDLNPIEEAFGYKRLLEEFSLTQEQIADKVSKSRSGIANSLRLLNLPPDVLEMLESDKISVGHAKVLLSVPDKDKQSALAEKVYSEALSVRELELLLKKKEKEKPQQKPKDLNLQLAYETIEKSMAEILGTKVKILDNKNKGKIQIEYYSPEDLDRIVNLLKTSEKSGS